MSKISLDPKIELEHIERARKDKQHFAPLYSHYEKHINRYFMYRTTNTEAAEELTAKVFEKALNGLDNFQWQGVSFSAWLYRIAHNTLVDFYRAENKNKAVSLELHKNIQSDENSPQQEVEKVFEEELLYKLLEELPPREKDIIYMKFFDGYTNRLISQLTGLSETNVGTIIYRAIKRMRQVYTEKY